MNHRGENRKVHDRETKRVLSVECEIEPEMKKSSKRSRDDHDPETDATAKEDSVYSRDGSYVDDSLVTQDQSWNRTAGMYDDQLGQEKTKLPRNLSASGCSFTANGKIEDLCKKLQIPSHSSQVEDLASAVRVSSDYNTHEEMLQLKKPKKKKCFRKREKVDLDALEAEASAEGLGASDLRSRVDSKNQTAREEEERAEAETRSNAYRVAFTKEDEPSRVLTLDQTLTTVYEQSDTDAFVKNDENLQNTFERAFKEKTEKAPTGLEAIARLAMSAVSSESLDAHKSTSGDVFGNKVVFTEMTEFVSGLQLETGGWTEVRESENDESSKTQVIDRLVLDDAIREVPVGKGLSVALNLLKERGTLKETTECYGRPMDKKKSKLAGSHEDDGPEEIHLERRDEFGRILTTEEAYRLFCHKFHGKGPGKRKLEKRMKHYQDGQC